MNYQQAIAKLDEQIAPLLARKKILEASANKEKLAKQKADLFDCKWLRGKYEIEYNNYTLLYTIKVAYPQEILDAKITTPFRLYGARHPISEHVCILINRYPSIHGFVLETTRLSLLKEFIEKFDVSIRNQFPREYLELILERSK